MNIYGKLLAVQTELKAPKGQYNSFGKYKYRSCEDILEAVKPILKNQGVTLTVSDEIVQVSDRIYIKAVATLTDGESSIENAAFAREPLTKKGMDDSQVTGTASSYARKYALNGLFLIDDQKDADTDEYSKQGYDVRPAPPTTINAEKIAVLDDIAAKSESDARLLDAIFKKLGKTKEQLTDGEYKQVINLICQHHEKLRQAENG